MFAKTATRVEAHTRPSVSARIRSKTARRVEEYRRSRPEALRERLDQLDAEWDIERGVEALFGCAMAVVGSLLLRHALTGSSPQTAVLRAAGFRTSGEIDEERRALLDLLATHPGR